MNKPNLKSGDIAVYYEGLFRVKEVNKRKDEMGYEYYEVHIGNLVVHANEVRKADFRDENRILKGAVT